MTTVNSLSLATVKLEQFCGGHLLGPASGFFYRKDSRMFLVSNWHVFSGRHPISRQPLHSKCWVPDVQKMYWHQIGPSQEIEMLALESRLLDNEGKAEWWEHPDKGSQIDVSIIELVGGWSSAIASAELALGKTLAVKAGMDVFVLGYPRGLTKQGFFPIWKRGSIASEPQLDVEGQPVLLIDTGTREGMSGSPVVMVQRSSGYRRDENGNVIVNDRARLLGVYSGRIGAEEFEEVQLGICWKSAVIDQIIEGKTPANPDIV